MLARPGLTILAALAVAGCTPANPDELVFALDSELDVFTRLEGPSTGKPGEELVFTTEAGVEPGRYASSAIDVATSADGHELRPRYKVGQLLGGQWKPLVASSFRFRPAAAGTYTIRFQLRTAAGTEPATRTVEVR